MSFIQQINNNFGITQSINGSWIQSLYEATVGGALSGATGAAGTSGTSGVSGTSGTSGGGGGGFSLPVLSNRDYGLAWSYYNPSPAGTYAGYGSKVIGFCAYVPAGTFNRFRTWVHTPAAGDIYMGLYSIDVNNLLGQPPMYKPVDLLGTSGPIPATSGEKVVNLAAPITLSEGYYFFATMYINSANTNWEGRYAYPTTYDKEVWMQRSLGGAWRDAFAVLGTWDGAAPISSGTYTSMPASLASETFFGTSLGFGFSLMAQ